MTESPTNMEMSMDDQFVYPKPLFVRKSAVESFAGQAAQKLNFRTGGDIQALVSRLGGKIVIGSSGHEDAESGSIIAKALNDFTVYISQFTSLERDRFTIAHEIGHLLLHLPALKKSNPMAIMRATRFVDESDEAQRRAEWEANWFAAALLMPSYEFREISPQGLTRLQEHFKVSSSAVKARAQSLEISL